MDCQDIGLLLSENNYPGRGIIAGMSEDAGYIFYAYFIMGRSENSRNRIFMPKGNAVLTQAYDESKVTDPSLIIYPAVMTSEGKIIVTNGDQTETIASFITQGKTFEQALETRTYEPDEPNFTPRISAVIESNYGKITYKMSILKHSGDDAGTTARLFWEYTPVPGAGHFIHTYKTDGNPLPSFEGAPKKIAVTGSLDEFAHKIWDNLNAENKISLLACSLDIKTLEQQTLIINKNT